MFSFATPRTNEARRAGAGMSYVALAALGLVCLGAAAFGTALRADHVAEKTRRAALDEAVSRLIAGHRLAADAAARNVALEQPGLADTARALRAARVLPAGDDAPDRLVLFRDGAPRAVAAAAGVSLDAAPPLPPPTGEGARMLSHDGRVYLVVDTIAPHPDLRVAALSEIGEARLAQLARAAGARELRLETVAPEREAPATLSLDRIVADGDTGPWLAWKPGRFVASSLIDALPLIAFLAAAFGVGLISNMRRSRADIADGDERARHHADHDRLTDLPNRARFSMLAEAAAVQALGSGGSCAVLCVDLRRFKEINDNYGHEFGDALLRETRDRIARFAGPQDVVARIASDVFAFLRIGESRAACARLARSLIEATGAPFSFEGVCVTPSATIGIALAADVGGPGELLRCADIALDHAKRESNAVEAFDPAMMVALTARKQLENDLRAALEKNQLEVVYQPVMSADGRSIIGAEALARWYHPTRGSISPAEFIPLAEERGLIDTLGDFVLRRACRDAADWPVDVFVAVNVSALQFRKSQFRAAVERLLDETGFEPQRLELELTESAVIADEISAEQTIMDLRARGVRMALDDFGTGYSSLIYLRRFAFDKIKIDRSFLESMESTGESATIIHSIVHLGRSLGLTVTAEGIETVDQHRYLQAVGCHEMQGFLFSRPVPIDDFRKMLGLDTARIALSA